MNSSLNPPLQKGLTVIFNNLSLSRTSPAFTMLSVSFIVVIAVSISLSPSSFFFTMQCWSAYFSGCSTLITQRPRPSLALCGEHRITAWLRLEGIWHWCKRIRSRNTSAKWKYSPWALMGCTHQMLGVDGVGRCNCEGPLSNLWPQQLWTFPKNWRKHSPTFSCYFGCCKLFLAE